MSEQLYLDPVNGTNYSKEQYLEMLDNNEYPAIQERANLMIEVSKDNLIAFYFDVLGESVQYLGLDKYSEVLQKSFSKTFQNT